MVGASECAGRGGTTGLARGGSETETHGLVMGRIGMWRDEAGVEGNEGLGSSSSSYGVGVRVTKHGHELVRRFEGCD